MSARSARLPHENAESPASAENGVERTLDTAVQGLARWASGISDASLLGEAGEGLDRVLANTVAVMAAGLRSEAFATVASSWGVGNGECILPGAVDRYSVEAAAWLGGVAAVSWELDEGHRGAGGHPAAQCFPGILALAQHLDSTGPELRRALLVAYEVTARLGAVSRLPADVHPHGVVGAAGAAAGCTVLRGGGSEMIFRAVTAGLGLPIAASWETVRQGSPLRDQWVGAANLLGLAAARFADAGLYAGEPHGVGSLASIDENRLTEALGGRWFITEGYLKRHSACAFLHAPADAAIAARAILRRSGGTAEDVVDVEVWVTGAARALVRTEWTTRHGAWFSVPYAVATALVCGDLGYERSDPEAVDPAVQRLARRVHVMDGEHLPRVAEGARPARVRLILKDRSEIQTEVAHPEGDQRLTPFSGSEQRSLIEQAATISQGAVSASGVLGFVQKIRAGGSVRQGIASLGNNT